MAEAMSERSAATFGVMGNGNAFVVGWLVRHGHRYVKARHEAGAMSMAQGYYLATGEIATVTTTYGPGYTNILTVLAEAAVARTPMVVVVGEGPRVKRPFDVDQAMAARAMGVDTLTVAADDAAALTRRAFELAARDLKPVIVSIPYDIAETPAAPERAVDPVEPRPKAPVAEADVARVAELLAAAERPLVISGRGALLSGAAEAAHRLGDRLGALFATSVMARRAVPSEWDLGIAGGFATLGAAALMRQADAVLVLGASMNTFQMRYGTLLSGARHVVQVDEREAATSPLVTEFVRADARDFAERLAEAVPRASGETWRDRVPGVADGSIHAPESLPETDAEGRINPRALALRLDELLPAERTIVQDGGHFLGWLAMHGSAPDPYGLQHPGLAFHSIGMGFPSALGASIGRPDRLTLLTCGDGGGMMTLPDLETLVREAERAVVVVFNDAAYGMEVHQYEHRGISAEPMVFEDVDLAAVARAFGAEAHTVTELGQLDRLGEWLAAGGAGTLFFDVKISGRFVAEYVAEKVEHEAARAAD
ncbi:thiamine pyrophosphate-binding protein [Gulosibacter sp. 10]|uniref:thiamine pyrophosphate-binding protein n=1 Tax=Gulosibacter sp. 10 TaxID=1255570 RepID=UPI00097F4E04|nr:thiamine pyrophosphate-binding protein [Gulosibacter sp. 10]SJM71127.1 TPP-requiring enzyme co-localized with fatty acid metabolic genes [Gulosibacter sp. 10]